MKKVKIFFTAMLALVSSVAFAQNITVTGTVIDSSNNEPVAFAAIQLKGTMTGGVSDGEGHYSVTVPADGVLVFSSVGYKTAEVSVNGKSVHDVMLEQDTQFIDETLVVAYGVQKKSSFVGSATQLSGKKLEKMQATNVSKSLEGAVAGLQTSSSTGTPGSSASLIIRGFGSVTAEQSPLLVVDGVPYEGSLNSISSHDIESITVLKDAAANSMYGARGSNGVIIVTTKGGQAGKVKISFNAKVGVNSRGVPSYDVIDNPAEYYEMAWESIRNSAYYASGMNYGQAGLYASSSMISEYGLYNAYRGVENARLIDPTTGKINPAATELKWNDSWLKDVFRAGVRQEYDVTVAGGSDKTRAYFSASYLDDQGIIPQSGFSRVSVRGKVDQQIGKYIKAGVNLSYSNTVQKVYNDSEDSNYANMSWASQAMPCIYPIYLYDNDGNRQYDEKGGVLYDWGETGRAAMASSNAYGQLMTSDIGVTTDNVSSRGYITVDILKDLKATANVAYDVFNSKENYFYSPVGGDAKVVNGRGYQYMRRYSALNTNQLIQYTPTFGDHSLDITLGHEIKKDSDYTLMGHMTNFVVSGVTDFSNAVVYQDLNSYTEEYFLQGAFARAEYSYAGRYFLSASYRMDGSSRFAPDKRWGSFWAVGASWNAKNESFLRDVNEVNFLKVKASYGTQGNDNIGYSIVYEDLYRIDRVDGEAAITKTFRKAPDVTWEKSRNFNVGFESKFFDRLNVNVEYFIKETKDMIYLRPLAPSMGLPSGQLVNDMDMMNRGVEFEISADLIRTKDVVWDFSVNGTHYRNEITKMPADKSDDGYQTGLYWRKLGGSLYDYYMYEYAGVDPENGLPMFNRYNDDGTVTTVNETSQASYVQTGKSPIPALYGGFSTGLSLYGFDISASFAYQIGGWVYDSNYESLMSAGNFGSNWHKDIYNRWTPQNRDTDVPRVQNGDQQANSTSTRFLTKASYLSLRNATIGYTFPEKMIAKAKMEGLRLYITGDNLWYISHRRGLDVRQSFKGDTGFKYSPIRTVSFGVTVTF